MTPKAIIIADDLTGAMDSAVAFADRSFRVMVGLSVESLPELLTQGVDVVAISTGTRETKPQIAAQVMHQLTSQLKDFQGIILKKVDSRLKGPIFEEISALSAEFSRPLFACPAIPKMGRLVSNGHLFGSGVGKPISISATLGLPAEVPEIRSEADIDSALPEDLTSVIFIGAAGLAGALARRLSGTNRPNCPTPKLPAPSLWAVGSRDPITMEQLERLSTISRLEAPNGKIAEIPVAPLSLIQMTDGEDAVDGHIASESFSRALGRAISRDQWASLFASGGETASAILSQLGVTTLEVMGEILPGIPMARTISGAKRLVIATKSGGFGPPDTLLQLARLVSPEGKPRDNVEKGP